MRFAWKDIKKLPVVTVSGQVLGHIIDLVFETEGQLLVQYIVRSSLLHHHTTYLVSRDQIVRYEADKIIVDDAVKPAPVKLKKSAPAPRFLPDGGMAARDHDYAVSS